MSIRLFSKLKFLIIVLLFSLSSIFCFADEGCRYFNSGTEPNGFAGIIWGTHIDAVRGMQLVETYPDNDVKVYVKEYEVKRIHGDNIDKIEYHFWEDKFYKVCMYISKTSDAAGMVSQLSRKYGRIRSKGKRLCYKGDTTGIIIIKRASKTFPVITMYSLYYFQKGK